MKTNSEVPVLLLTGYLGSGKTTLLNRILSNQKGVRFAVIVNDIGEVNIDASLIQKGGIVGQKDDSLVALQNGCICCTLKMDLVEQLCGLSESGNFDYIVIEASGICEPGPIAQTINAIPQLKAKTSSGALPKLDCIVTVVDALRLKSEFDCGEKLPEGGFEEDDLEKLIIEQLEFCNLILLNKSSEVNPDELGRIKGIIRTIQPRAEIIPCDWCDVPLEKLIETGSFDFEKVATSAAWISEIEGSGKEEELHNEEEGEALEYGIGTFVYFRRDPLDINKFDNWVAKRFPREIIRAKGLCYFSDDPDRCYLFEQAGPQKSIKDAGLWLATMPKEELAQMALSDPTILRDWDPDYGDRMIKLVFIGQNMPKDEIIAALDSCLIAA